MILLIPYQPDGSIDSVAFVPDTHGASVELGGDLPVLRIAAHDALKSWKGDTLSSDALHQEVLRARSELREKHVIQHGKLVPRS